MALVVFEDRSSHWGWMGVLLVSERRSSLMLDGYTRRDVGINDGDNNCIRLRPFALSKRTKLGR